MIEQNKKVTGVYKLDSQVCEAANVATTSQTANLIVDAYDSTAQTALALNPHQPQSFAAIQATDQGLRNNPLQAASVRGLEIKSALEETNRELKKAKEKERESALNFAEANIDANGWDEGLFKEVLDATEKVKILEAEKAELKNSLNLAGDLVDHHIRQNSFDPYPFITEARVASARAALGQYEKARVGFQTAADEAKRWGMSLASADFWFQSLVAEAQEGKNWEITAKNLENFLTVVDRETRLREDGPKMFSIWLAEQGDTESWRTLRAEALGAVLEIYLKHGSPTDQANVDRHIKTVLAIFEGAGKQGLPEEETLALLDAMQVADRWQVAQGYRLGADGKVSELEGLFQKMKQEFETASASIDWYPDHKGIKESLGLLEGLTYFHFWQQAGMPTKAVFTYWQQTARSPYSKGRADLRKTIQEKAPHFFDRDGCLLPKEKIPLPNSANDAAFAENSLHYDDASLSENLMIGGGASFAGAIAGAKAGALAGGLCGPFAETCVPLGAALGGTGSYLGGDQIIRALHSKERKQFVEDAKRAGLSLARLSLDEANQNEIVHGGTTLLGVGVTGVASGAMARSGGKFLSGLSWLTRGETWRFVGRRIVYEGHYSLRWVKALGRGSWGALTGSGKQAAASVETTPLFEKAWQLLPPWRQALGQDYWRARWSEAMALRSATPVPSGPVAIQTSRPLIDIVLEPLNKGWDQSIGLVTRFGSNRLRAIREAVLAGDPALSFDANPLIARKELLRAAHLFEHGVTPNGNGFIKWPMFERAGKWLTRNVGTPEFEKAHRFGAPIAATGLFYDSDGDNGGGWGWDGELDAGWEFYPFFFAANSLSKPLFDNAVLGADVAGAINLYTIDKMLAMNHYEGPTDYARYRGAHLHYFAATVANSVFISGLHYMRNFPLGQILGSIPFARMAPSMTSFPSTFRLGSSMARPNFFTAAGLGLTLLYQGYGTGYVISDIFSDKRLINTDPYYSWQRGTKYAVVVPPTNALQAAFGYRSTLGQTLGRVVAIPADLGLAKPFPPFLSKGRYENKVDRLLGEKSPSAKDKLWEVFTSANTSFDLGGVVGRMVDIEHPLQRFKGWKAPHFGWRWETRAVATWTSPTPLPSLDGKKGYIQQLADVGDYRKIEALAAMYRHQFVDPQAPWHEEIADQRGMIIFAFIAKYFAKKGMDEENLIFDPFMQLIRDPALAEFFKAIPVPKDHRQLLSYVSQVDEGQFLWLLQRAPNPPTTIGGSPVSRRN